MEPFVMAVAKTIDRYQLLAPGDRVVVGVSGGPDSTALLAALAELRSHWRLELIAAHLDHGLRGEAGAEDARFAGELARRFGARFVLQRVDVAALARRRGTSLEAAGRAARYDFFERVADRYGCAGIAVGHHRDDQVETVLLRLLSGTGSDGLAGMRPRRGRIIRPLLERTRDEILAYLRRRDLAFRQDETNRSWRFLRNRIRHQLLPLLREGYNRRVDDAIWRLSQRLADDVAHLEAEAGAILERARLPLPDGFWLEARTLAEAPAPLRRRALRQAVWRLATHGEARLGDEHVAALESVAAGEQSAADLPGGVRVEYQQGRLRFSRRDPVDPAAEVDAAGSTRELPIPGVLPLWPPWRELRAEVLVRPPLEEADLARPGHAFLDYQAMGCPAALNVRRWQAGDRMHPLGAPGVKKLQDIFVDRRIPRLLRKKIPVVTVEESIVWLVGVAIADAFRIRATTEHVLHLSVDGESDVACCDSLF